MLEFWIVVAVVFGPVVLAVWILVPYTFLEHKTHNKHKRFMQTTRFKADNLGNYELFYNWRTGDHFAPPPGNKAYSEQYVVLNGKVAPPTKEDYVPINYKTQPEHHSQTDWMREQAAKIAAPKSEQLLENSQQEQFLLDEPSSKAVLAPIPGFLDASVIEELRTKYTEGEGRGKIEAIKNIAGINRGRSAKYEAVSQWWDAGCPD